MLFLSINIVLVSQDKVDTGDISIDELIKDFSNQNSSLAELKTKFKADELQKKYNTEIEIRMGQINQIDSISIYLHNRIDSTQILQNNKSKSTITFYKKLYNSIINCLYKSKLGHQFSPDIKYADVDVMRVYLNQINKQSQKFEHNQTVSHNETILEGIKKLKSFKISLLESIDFIKDEQQVLANAAEIKTRSLAENLSPLEKAIPKDSESKKPISKKIEPKKEPQKNKYNRIQKEVATIKKKNLVYSIDFGKDNKSFEDRKGFMRWPVDSPQKSNTTKSNSWEISSTSPYAYCVSQGQVVYLGKSDISKFMVIILHDNGYLSVYDNLQNAYLNPAQRIGEGQLIGDLTPSGENYKIYFQIWKDTQQLNPSRWLKNN